jgi:phenylalanyl-tRNA synthetase alpha subunit
MVGNNQWQADTQQWIENNYPNLVSSGYKVTSQDTIDYNCVAWAVEDQESWWWPKPNNEDYWPPNIPREETIEAFVIMFQSLNYETCEASDLEKGYQKIAIYTLNNKPTHVARQLSDGTWTSKLGQYEDIQHHTLEGLEGEKYGTVTIVMKRVYSGKFISLKQQETRII